MPKQGCIYLIILPPKMHLGKKYEKSEKKKRRKKEKLRKIE
jgi:hypothetical protein